MKVNLGLRASANARELHAARKRQSTKLQKTVEAHSRSLTQVEKKAAQQLAAARASAAIAVARKPLWFEKFRWFVTSENYLVLSGAPPIFFRFFSPWLSLSRSSASAHICAIQRRSVRSVLRVRRAGIQILRATCDEFLNTSSDSSVGPPRLAPPLFASCAGNDAQQMDILLKRFFRPGDAYVGCEVARSLGFIVKNPKGAWRGGKGKRLNTSADTHSIPPSSPASAPTRCQLAELNRPRRSAPSPPQARTPPSRRCRSCRLGSSACATRTRGTRSSPRQPSG